MSVVNAVPLLEAAGGGYQISRSVRLRSSASAYLTKVYASTTLTWTFSCWVKRGKLGIQQMIAGARSSGAGNTSYIAFGASDNLLVTETGVVHTSTPVYRDPSAWYHVVVSVTPSATSYAYVNGVLSMSWTSGASPFLFTTPGTGYNNAIGIYGDLTSFPFDGYLTEINYIDGQALTPSSFGENDAITGVWKPKKYAGTYGTNGFYLNFSDNSASTATTIGKDYSGNGNNWIPNNISVTAGSTYDSMIDVPTMWADGGNGRGNYAVMNPLNQSSVSATPTNGNLTVTQATNFGQVASTLGMDSGSGKWYYEHTVTAVGGEMSIGIGAVLVSTGTIGTASTQYGYYSTNGQKYNNNVGTAYGATFTTGDVIGVAYDAIAGSLTFYKNGTSQGVAFTGITGTMFALACTRTASGTNISDLNFGQRPFTYTPPTGFKALNTQNLPDATIKKGSQYFDTSLFTGTSGNVTISGLGFQPDFVWLKARSNAQGHTLFDSVRGANKYLQSNLTNAEATMPNPPSFTSDGWISTTDTHTSGFTYAAWEWRAGGISVSNTSGTITSTVSANPTAGFSVVTYTNPASGSSWTVGHGLGVAPSMIITKQRSAVSGWTVYHKSLGATNAIFLQATNASAANTSFNNTAPTSTVMSYAGLGTNFDANATEVAYCFAEVAGYSRFGSYTGNGSADGPFVFCGFRPRFVMFKRTDAVSDWAMYDTSRNTYNESNLELNANLSGAEFSTTGTRPIDILSNGFKLRGTNGGGNASGGTYIFMAFAENPFKNSLAR